MGRINDDDDDAGPKVMDRGEWKKLTAGSCVSHRKDLIKV